MGSIESIINEVSKYSSGEEASRTAYRVLHQSGAGREYNQSEDLKEYEKIWLNDLRGFIDHYIQGERDRERLIQKVRVHRDPGFGNLLSENVIDAFVLGHQVQVPYSLYFNTARNIRARMILDEVRDDTTAVIELGSGTGMALVDVWKHGVNSKIPLVCMEPTYFGRLCFEFLVDLEPKINGRAIYFNFNDHSFPDTSGIDPTNAVIFSSGSVEFVEELSETLVRDLLSRFKKVCGVHLEPLGWQIPTLEESAIKSRAKDGPTAKGQNRNLWQLLKRLDDLGIIALEKKYLFGVFGASQAPLTYIRWNKL